VSCKSGNDPRPGDEGQGLLKLGKRNDFRNVGLFLQEGPQDWKKKERAKVPKKSRGVISHTVRPCILVNIGGQRGEQKVWEHADIRKARKLNGRRLPSMKK